LQLFGLVTLIAIITTVADIFAVPEKINQSLMHPWAYMSHQIVTSTVASTTGHACDCSFRFLALVL
jgi:hypothetical protein